MLENDVDIVAIFICGAVRGKLTNQKLVARKKKKKEKGCELQRILTFADKAQFQWRSV